MNRLREALSKGEFAVTVEVVAPERSKELGVALAPILRLARALASDPRLVGLSVTDRVKSDRDHDPIRIALEVAWASGKAPLVHLSGKDRTPADLERSLRRLDELGLENVLCVTGDRLKTPPPDRAVRYLDSVDAVRLTRALLPGSLIAAAVSPYKYTEETALNQYLKMAKKHLVGADYVITQVGWDMRKLAELIRYRAERGLTQPAVANLMLLPPGAARFIHKGGVPGVVVTDDLLTLVEAEAQAPDKGVARRFGRLALQVVGAERMGYAGVQLSTLGRFEDVRRALDLVAEWRTRLPTLPDWAHAWEETLRLPDGRPARLDQDPGYFVFDPLPSRVAPGRGGAAAPLTVGARARYWTLWALGQAVFHRASPVHRLLRPLARRVAPDSSLASWLTRIERRIKAPLFGCQTCGFCRLPDTFYVCPETCPKGLANGPCGGSSGNLCEAGDRECIHSVKYRIAKAAAAIDSLERTVIPPVPAPHHGSSWINHFAGRDPEIVRGPERR